MTQLSDKERLEKYQLKMQQLNTAFRDYIAKLGKEKNAESRRLYLKALEYYKEQAHRMLCVHGLNAVFVCGEGSGGALGQTEQDVALVGGAFKSFSSPCLITSLLGRNITDVAANANCTYILEKKDGDTIVHSCGTGCGGALGQVSVDDLHQPIAASTSWLPKPTTPFYAAGLAEDEIVKLGGRSDVFVAVGGSGCAYTSGSRKATGGQYFRPSIGAADHPYFSQWDQSLQSKDEERIEPPFGKQFMPIQIGSVPGEVSDVASSDDVIFMLLNNGRVYSAGIMENNTFAGGAFTTPLGRVPTRSMYDEQARKWNHEVICEEYLTPKEIILPYNFIAEGIAAGAFHAFAWGKLNGERAVFGWGSNKRGQLGLGTTDEFVDTPTRIVELDGCTVNQIAGGRFHTLFLIDSSIFACGSNVDGQLGLDNNPGPKSEEGVPRKLSIFHDANNNWINASVAIKSVECGNDESYAVSADGKAFSWGFVTNGSLGHGPYPDDEAVQSRPRMVDIPGRVLKISADAQHSVFLVEMNEK